MKSFFKSLDLIEDYSKNAKDTELYSLCSSVRSYILNSGFSSCKREKEYLALWGETDSSASKKLGVSESTVRVTRRNMSNTLYELFGYDFFTVIKSSRDISEGLLRLSIVENCYSSANLLPLEVKKMVVGEASLSQFNIKDCAKEIRFLAKYSVPSMKKELSSLNKDKVAYLIRVLDKEEGTLIDTNNFINYILNSEGGHKDEQ